MTGTSAASNATARPELLAVAMGQLTFDNLHAHFTGAPLLTPVDA
jgi:hypothetical protein